MAQPASSVHRAGAGAVSTPRLLLGSPGCSTWKPEGTGALTQFTQVGLAGTEQKGRRDRGTGQPSGTVSGLVLCKFLLLPCGLPFPHKDGLVDLGFLVRDQTCCMYVPNSHRYMFHVCID